jgi:hypothetical protein
MMPKHYTPEQVAEQLGMEYEALRKQLQRDAKKPRNQRKYPRARKCECGHGWLIPAKDVTEIEQERNR